LWMIWAEIAVCLAFSIACWLYIRGIIAPRYQSKYQQSSIILLTRC
jgi:hypothetical protein